MKKIIVFIVISLFSINSFSQKRYPTIKETINEKRETYSRISESEKLQIEFEKINKQIGTGESLFWLSIFIEGANYIAYTNDKISIKTFNNISKACIITNFISIPIWIYGVNKKGNFSLKVSNYYKGGGLEIKFNF